MIDNCKDCKRECDNHMFEIDEEAIKKETQKLVEKVYGKKNENR